MHQLLLLIFAHLPIVDGVYIGPHGPFRFAFDTGAESTSIDAQLAQKLNLTPQYRVELVTAAASSLAPALRAELRTSAGKLPDTEAILLPLERQAGILGQSALRRLDYQIDSVESCVRFSVSPGHGAIAMPLVYIQNRIAVPIRFGDKLEVLILDSGSNTLMLPMRFAGFQQHGFAQIQTHNGSGQVPYGKIEKMEAGRFTFKDTPAAIVALPYGLLPTSLFRRITVSNSSGTIYLEK